MDSDRALPCIPVSYGDERNVTETTKDPDPDNRDGHDLSVLYSTGDVNSGYNIDQENATCRQNAAEDNVIRCQNIAAIHSNNGQATTICSTEADSDTQTQYGDKSQIDESRDIKNDTVSHASGHNDTTVCHSRDTDTDTGNRYASVTDTGTFIGSIISHGLLTFRDAHTVFGLHGESWLSPETETYMEVEKMCSAETSCLPGSDREKEAIYGGGGVKAGYYENRGGFDGVLDGAAVTNNNTIMGQTELLQQNISQATAQYNNFIKTEGRGLTITPADNVGTAQLPQGASLAAPSPQAGPVTLPNPDNSQQMSENMMAGGMVAKPVPMRRLSEKRIAQARACLSNVAGSSHPGYGGPVFDSIVASSPALARAISMTSQRRPRSEKKQIPEDLKDDKYFERRKRNNSAAKKSRDSRKAREDEIAIRASFLEKENAILRAQVATLREEANSLRQLLLQKRSAVRP